jgi:catechol 2,3-dioxygenase
MECEMETSQGLFVPIQKAPDPIDAGIRIGHVHLRTADIDRVRAFYVDVLGFDVIAEARDVPGWGTTGDLLFLSAGGYHHHLGFNTWRGEGVPAPPPRTVGLRHWTVVLPSPEAVAEVRARLEAGGVAVEAREDGAVVARDPWGLALALVAEGA